MEAKLDMVLEQVGRDKNIDKTVLISALEQAILTAAKRTFGMNREMEAKFNPETGSVDLFLIVNVVEEDDAIEGREITVSQASTAGLEAELGDELLFQVFYRAEDEDRAREQDEKFGNLIDLKNASKKFGRIAAQTAKQVIYQRVREAERDNVYNEFKDRKARGPQVILSRTHKGLLEKLFEQEVPEIYEKIVRIESSAREPGARAKIAVSSRDRDVDPVGACVGMKGSRVQAVVQELRGEKIDIVPYDDDPARFVCNAIAPAEVSRVIIDAEGHRMELIVPDDKLSLAIGKKGQNVRLASQLTGWKIDIHSESKIRELEAQAKRAMASLPGVGDEHAETLFKLGWRSVPDLADAVAEELASVPGLGGLEAARRIVDDARAWLAEERQRHLSAQRESQRRASLNDEQKLLELRGVDGDLVARLKGAGYPSVDSLARENDAGRLAGAAEIEPETAARLVHRARVYLGDLPPDSPEPDGP